VSLCSGCDPLVMWGGNVLDELFDLSALIGMPMLIDIVVTNAIVLLALV
jgi:multidrug efflux pump subunit AcrB